MFDKVMREFVAVVGHLLKQPEPWISGEQLIVPKQQLLDLLDRHPYIPAYEKLQSWRSLGWIDCEDGRFRSRVQKNGKSLVAIKINLTAFYEVIRLRQMEAE